MEDFLSVDFLTKYERVQLIGARMEQLARGAPPCVEAGERNVREIAEKELRNGVLPLMLRRKLPNGVKEKRRLRDLET